MQCCVRFVGSFDGQIVIGVLCAMVIVLSSVLWFFTAKTPRNDVIQYVSSPDQSILQKHKIS